MANYPIQKLSFSCLRTFFTNPGEFKDRYILNDYKFKYTPAMLVGKMAHKVNELYFTGSTIEKAVEHAQNFLETVNDDDVKWGKTGSREKILREFTQAVKNYFEEMPKYGEIVSVEQELFSEIKDTIDGKQIVSPLPFHGFTDLLYRLEKLLHIEDYKFVTQFTDPENENPAYIFQAFFYYYLVFAVLGEAPRDCTFREIKISTNKDGSSQHNCIVIPFYGEKFEENKVYFWYNVSSMLKQIEGADENTIFLYNIFDSLNGVENYKRQKETVFGYSRDEVKQTEFSKVEERGQKEVRYIESKQAATIEDKIKVKFQDYGVALKFGNVERGYSYDRYLFEPGRGVKMAKVASLNEEIKQALESKQIRIEAPVSGTKYIGIEVPRQDRVFLPLDKKDITEDAKIPLGKGIDGKTIYVDLKDSNTPHLLVVGATGSGKSEQLKVCIEALKGSSKLHLVDPKRTELVRFKDIATSYTFDPEGTLNLLETLYGQMMKRYEHISGKGYKDIDEYNKKSKTKLERETIVIEEYSLLKLSYIGKQIEHAILRIAALGRAAGFHIILSTQRPDVTVVSGGLKANISARVCFTVASSIDSKVALDEIGAENLVGKGDMLYKSPGHDLQRLQGFYIA